ncbi:sensor histidine kinase [Dyella nitratireducens]|uniref:histidine kinase n=2 Tax=Dyella nitratireducens TaxID=1849580 RepID=A0ABQ1GBQ8_9GAMM|nr:7TM diverse intracellular signaling domain-containing protein [Dyella nitratireducens]GGA40597.1 histidine kinase [Dyella nitratireducens]GLQ40583.1 histidine kinase [Dyella nitratireducens]
MPVSLLDDWSKRWPTHDGVVWYRLHMNVRNANQPIGLLLDYVCLADAVYVNGSLVHRDPSLTEPLSRSWVAPQYFLLDKPLLQSGDNIVLIRVSGLAAYQPGLGTVRYGDPQAAYSEYRKAWLVRYQLRFFDFAISAVLGGVFLMMWLFRRKDTTYGWYALNVLIGAVFEWNYIASDVWPFSGTDGFEAFNVAVYVAYVCSFAVFLLRYCERRWPRLERILFVLSLLAFACALCAPGWVGPSRGPWIAVASLIYYIALPTFMIHAWRSRKTDQRVLALCLIIPMVASVHDILLFYELVHDRTYLLALTAPFTLVGMGFVLAYRFSAAMRRVDGFNTELQTKVDAATTELSTSLEREHTLALATTRMSERLNLVRDLHDGFGGSLVSAIAALEHPASEQGAKPTIETLKELRDDLRLVIDTTAQDHSRDLAELLGPFRYRWTRRLDAIDIEARWQFESLEGLHLSAAQQLDLLRFLQEALTNVMKHSGATCVDVTMRVAEENLHVTVQDNGRGFDPVIARANAGGAGLNSLNARAHRLNGAWVLDAEPGTGATLKLIIPLITAAS